jgi:hypothetical protein
MESRERKIWKSERDGKEGSNESQREQDLMGRGGYGKQGGEARMAGTSRGWTGTEKCESLRKGNEREGKKVVLVTEETVGKGRWKRCT